MVLTFSVFCRLLALLHWKWTNPGSSCVSVCLWVCVTVRQDQAQIPHLCLHHFDQNQTVPVLWSWRFGAAAGLTCTATMNVWRSDTDALEYNDIEGHGLRCRRSYSGCNTMYHIVLLNAKFMFLHFPEQFNIKSAFVWTLFYEREWEPQKEKKAKFRE